jgi:hypothetical protein
MDSRLVGRFGLDQISKWGSVAAASVPWSKGSLETLHPSDRVSRQRESISRASNASRRAGECKLKICRIAAGHADMGCGKITALRCDRVETRGHLRTKGSRADCLVGANDENPAAGASWPRSEVQRPQAGQEDLGGRWAGDLPVLEIRHVPPGVRNLEVCFASLRVHLSLRIQPGLALSLAILEGTAYRSQKDWFSHRPLRNPFGTLGTWTGVVKPLCS